MGVHEAKTHLSELLRRVAAGEEILITRSGISVAKLVPVTGGTPRTLGIDRGVLDVPADFNAPLPESVVSRFET